VKYFHAILSQALKPNRFPLRDNWSAHVVRIADICHEFINRAIPVADMLASRMLRDGTKDKNAL
jgi:hypothetical protein